MQSKYFRDNNVEMLRKPFITSSCYHILNRGVEKRDIFMDDADRRRFLIYLTMFNSGVPIINFSKKIFRNKIEAPPRLERLVHIISYCLMKNHFHILLLQAKDGGIEQFMHKLGTGYTMFFNKRYERVGPLFQGVFKAVPVTNDVYLSYLTHYIHANPLDFSNPEWRQNIMLDSKLALQNIRTYPWSSFSHYMGKVTNPAIDDKMIIDLFSDKKSIVSSMDEWLSDMAAKNSLINSGVILE